MELIYSYTRADAIADGMQIKCELAAEAGFKYPVYITKGINDLINEALEYGANDYNGVMWDFLSVLKAGIRKQHAVDRVQSHVYINWHNNRPKSFHFQALIGALDFDDPQPAITIMLPDED